MFETSKDILNISLAVGFGFIALFFSIALFYVIFVLRDLSQTTNALRQAAKKVNVAIVQPLKLAKSAMKHSKEIIAFVDKYVGKKSKK